MKEKSSTDPGADTNLPNTLPPLVPASPELSAKIMRCLRRLDEPGRLDALHELFVRYTEQCVERPYAYHEELVATYIELKELIETARKLNPIFSA